MNPEQFVNKVETAIDKDKDWILSFYGRTAVQGLRLAVLSNGSATRIIAADTDPASSALSDHKVQQTQTYKGGPTAYLDAIPTKDIEGFTRTDTTRRILDNHTDLLKIANEDPHNNSLEYLRFVHALISDAVSAQEDEDGYSVGREAVLPVDEHDNFIISAERAARNKAKTEAIQQAPQRETRKFFKRRP
jgi:hypothetical protein